MKIGTVALKVHHASKGSGEPPLGLYLVSANWKRSRHWRFPKPLRRAIGWFSGLAKDAR